MIESKGFSPAETLLIDTAQKMTVTLGGFPPIHFNIPDYYEDYEGNRRAVKDIEESVDIAFTTALAEVVYQNRHGARVESIFIDRSVEELNCWFERNDSVQTGDHWNEHYFVVKCSRLLLAIRLLRQVGFVVRMDLLDNRFRWLALFTKTADNICRDWNNHGIWGLYGKALVYDVSRNFIDPTRLQDDIRRWWKRATWKVPFLQSGYELWLENLRNNSALWYTHFALAPLLAAARILGDDALIGEVKPYVQALHGKLAFPVRYYQEHQRFPYKAYGGLLGKVQRTLFESEQDPIDPGEHQWPAIYMAVTSHIYGYHDREIDPTQRLHNVWPWAPVLLEHGLI